MYGLPIERRFEMNDRYDVINTIKNFNDCPHHRRYILADNIKKAFNEFGITKPIVVTESNMILHFLNESYVIIDNNFIHQNINLKNEKNITPEFESFMKKIATEELFELDIFDFRYEVMSELNDITDSLITDEVVYENLDLDKQINGDNIIQNYLMTHDMDKVLRKLECVKKQYNVTNDLDDINLFKIKKKLMDSDGVYFPKAKYELGNLVCINKDIYIVCKDNKSDCDFILIDAFNLDNNKYKKIHIKNINKDVSALDIPFYKESLNKK